MSVDKVVDSGDVRGVGARSLPRQGRQDHHVEGRDGPANDGRLCVRAVRIRLRHHPQRLTTPLIRRADARSVKCAFSCRQWREVFREASWKRRWTLLPRFNVILTAGSAGAGRFGSAKGSNEEAYLVPEAGAHGLRTNNVDHCTRLCHASSCRRCSKASGRVRCRTRCAMSRWPRCDRDRRQPSVNHRWRPASSRMREARHKLICSIAPRRSGPTRLPAPGVQGRYRCRAVNAMMHVIVEKA